MPASVVSQVVNLHRAQLQGIIELGGVKKIRALYEQARLELEEKLADLKRRGASDTFSAHHMRMVLLQVRDGLVQFQDQMVPALQANARAGATLARRHTASAIKKFERRFSGTEPVLRIEETGVFQRVYHGVEPSLLDRYHKLTGNYPLATIQRVRGAMAMSLIEGGTVGDVVDRVAGTMGIFAKERWRAERIVRTECLLGDTLIDSAVVGAVFRRPYDGPVVEIVTSRGRQFSTTPNHPVLTRRGWVIASKVAKGDDLVCRSRNQHARFARDEDVTRPPTEIGKIFDALSAVGIEERMSTGNPDFHGDGMEGHVDIARASRVLRIGEFAAIYEPLAKQVFSKADLGNASFCQRCRRLLSFTGQPCLCSVSNSDTHLLQPSIDRRPADVEAMGYLNRALSFFVAFANHCVADVVPVLPTLAAAVVEGPECVRSSARDTFFSADAMNAHFRDVQLAGYEAGAVASEIEFDHVVAIAFRQFSGHVFNLSTLDGYYTMNGVYSGNCAYAYGVTNQKMLEETVKEVPRLMKRLVETIDDRTGDDSKELNGQTVPVDQPFVWIKHTKAGDVRVEYMAPPNRPHDRAVVVPWRGDYHGAPLAPGPVKPSMPGGVAFHGLF